MQLHFVFEYLHKKTERKIFFKEICLSHFCFAQNYAKEKRIK